MKLVLNITQEEFNAFVHYTKENTRLQTILSDASLDAQLRERQAKKVAEYKARKAATIEVAPVTKIS